MQWAVFCKSSNIVETKHRLCSQERLSSEPLKNQKG